MKNVFFIARTDVRNQLRDGGTLAWLFVMPPIFFFFIGTVMSGFSSGMSGGEATPIVVVAKAPGFLQEQIDLRLRQNEFDPEWLTEVVADEDGNPPTRVLTLSDNFSDKITAAEQVDASYDTKASALLRSSRRSEFSAACTRRLPISSRRMRCPTNR